MKTLRNLVMLAAASGFVPLAVGDTLASSSVSDSISTSVGSVSDSIKGSSNTSSNSSRRNDVAAGDYRVVEVAAVADRPGTLRVALQPLAAGAAPFELWLPQAAAERGQLATGAVVTARHREYGIEFTAAALGQPFYLVLQDERLRELPSRPVTL